MKKHRSLVLLCILATISTIQFTSAVNFLFNGFDSSDVSLYGNATIESRILTLTKDSGFELGRALYPSKIPTKQPNTSLVLPFSTSFIFAMAPYPGRFAGHGMVFLFVPHEGIQYSSSTQYLGMLNLTNDGDPNNHIFGVEFDVFANLDFADINNSHVGIDVNSLESVSAHEAGYWPDECDHKKKKDGNPDERSFKKLVLNDGKNYQAWIDYADSILNVTMAPVGMKRPKRPLLSVPLNLSQVLENEMYVGFTASTGQLIESHKILGWSFSNANFSLSAGLITEGLPSFELPKTSIHITKDLTAGVAVGILSFAVVCSAAAFMFVRRRKKISGERKEMEDWELEYWPHRIPYQEIATATMNFADENVIGIGGNGKVYRGVLPGGSEVAVKCIYHENTEISKREFFAEISSLGRVKHRNLVGLRGWCKKEKGRRLILVYDYMENGSLDKRVFECDERKMLSCEDRIRILKQVASGILYLHEGWERKVLHRDIKASNVLLDKEMNARLGDFGLAMMHDHDKAAGITRVVGTMGYLAPEIVKTGRASTKTDVYAYGVLILEVMCGRRPIEQGMPLLIDWVRQLFRRGELLNVIDARLKASRNIDKDEVEKVLQLGLLCAHPEPNARPTMRKVVNFFEGKNESEEEEMELYLPQKLESGEILSIYHQIVSPASVSHPAFYDITQGASSCNALSGTTTILEGR